MTNRSVKYQSESSAGSGAQETKGTARTVNPMPAPDEVLAFEMPPIRGAAGAPALPNQLSVRVRIDR